MLRVLLITALLLLAVFVWMIVLRQKRVKEAVLEMQKKVPQPEESIVDLDIDRIPPTVKRVVRPITREEAIILQRILGPFSWNIINEKYTEVEVLEFEVRRIWDLNPHDIDCCQPVLILELVSDGFLYLTAAGYGHAAIFEDGGELMQFCRKLIVVRTTRDQIPLDVRAFGKKIVVEKAVTSEALSAALCEPLSPLFEHLSVFFSLREMPPVLSGDVDQSMDAPLVTYLHPAHGRHPITSRNDAISRWGCLVVLVLVVLMFAAFFLYR